MSTTTTTSSLTARISVVAAFGLMVVSNFLSTATKLLNNTDNAQISRENPTYLSPDGATFSIWGLIYLFEAILVVYQAFPSFRVHIPNDQAIHKWHHDSDENHNHPDWEINFQVALTKMWDSNAMWLESVPGLGDFKPVEMEVGDYTIFYGNKCAHGNKENKTGKTRVSIDFRVLPYDKYDESSAKNSATAGTKFVIGQYYNLYEQ